MEWKPLLDWYTHGVEFGRIMGYAALGDGLSLVAAHLDDLYIQQTPLANTYKWRLVLSYDGT